MRALSPDFHIHVSVSDLNIPMIGPHVFLQQNRQIDCGFVGIYCIIAHRHMYVGIGTEAAQFLFWEYLLRVIAVLKLERIRGTCLAKQRRLKYTSLFMYSRGCKFYI
jgi:hypothetical protein